MPRAIERLICLFFFLCFCVGISSSARAQQLQGSITGTVFDSTGAVAPDVKVEALNLATGLKQTTVTHSRGEYNLFDLPPGTYSVTFTKEGFKAETHSQVEVQANRTTTVEGSLQPGTVSTTVTVTGTPLLNKVDTTNGYVLSSAVIQAIPLGTGSFTQLATLSPGVNADLLAGSDTNAGLGNQAIWSNGQRDTSNSISFNAINANNVFNGKTGSSVSGSRFVLSTGENFLAGGSIQTSTSVYNAIGQGIPTPPTETIEELRVNAAQYDASQGANSGAHIEIMTRSGANDFHGQLYGNHQRNAWNSAPFFFNSDPAIAQSDKVPFLRRSTFGGTLGGPIKRDKMFFFGSYQGIRDHDQFNATSRATVPLQLTNDRSAATLAAEFTNTNPFVGAITPDQIDPAALALFNAKVPGGGFLIPTPNDPNSAPLGFDTIIRGPAATFSTDQFNGNIDYNFSSQDRLSVKYYYQQDPTTSPFGVSNLLGFPQKLNAGSQVISVDNTTILGPALTWEQKIGFIREVAFANTTQAIKSTDVGINLFGNTRFPGITIDTGDPTVGSPLGIGPSSPFANAGIFQNQFDTGTNLHWIRGSHSMSFGANWDRNQLNVLNPNSQVAQLEAFDIPSLLVGSLRFGENHTFSFQGSSNRYYRSNQIGAYAQDNLKISPNVTLSLGLRFDYDGPLSEKNGFLTNFYPQRYKYDLASDTILNDGLVIAGNNTKFHTPGVSNSTLLANQFGFAPRIGIAWSPAFVKNLVVRAGVGMYYDRGQFFTEFSPSAGNGFNGPFGVTLAPPFILPFTGAPGSTSSLSNPFGTTAPPPPPSGDPAAFAALLPNIAQLSGNAPYSTNNQFGPLLFGGYDPTNKLPYSENWSLDLQWQPVNNLILTLGYVGNHGVHEVLPIPFNQARIATPQSPVNGQLYSYGYQPLDSSGNPLVSESIDTGGTRPSGTGGNTDLRVPYIGYSPNSIFYKAEGISNYNSLQFSVNKRLSHGLQVNGSYTWSHSLDQGSGLGLFFNGNDPLNLHTAYGSSDFDRTHVLNISYLYQFPRLGEQNSLAGKFVNGWGFSGVTTLESGQPYSVYDFSGSVASIYYSANDFITNPLVPLAPGKTSASAQLQGTTGVNPGKPVLDPTAFALPLLAPGQSGVPPCGPTVGGTSTNFCDTVESGYGNSGRNLFRGPFQARFDFSLQKETKLSERFQLRYSADFFNIFNHPSFDAPNNDVTFNPCFNPQPCYTFPPHGHLGIIQHPLGSPRFIQMALHLVF